MAGFNPISGTSSTGTGNSNPTDPKPTDSLKDKSPEELMKALTDPNTKPEQVGEIVKALAEKLGGKDGAGGVKDKDKDGEDDKDELKKLLKKLKEGKITPEEMQKVQGLMEKMGAPPEAIQNMIKNSGQTPPDPNKVS